MVDDDKRVGTPENAIGDGWEMGSRDNVDPPDAEYVHQKFRLVAPDLCMLLLEAEYERSYLDGVYGIMALAWEKVEYGELTPGELDSLGERMLCFFFGAPLPEVLRRLSARGYSLEVIPLTEKTQEDTSLGAAFPDTDDLF